MNYPLLKRNCRDGQEGQVLLVAILIVTALMLTIPFLTNFLNIRSVWTASSEQADKALLAANAGVAQAIRIVGASQAAWDDARGNNLARTGVTPLLFNGGNPIAIADSQGMFSLQLNTELDYTGVGANMGPRYLTEITSMGRYKNAERAIQVGLRARGFGVHLPTGQTVYPAVMLGHDMPPGTAANLSVYWGPLVVYDNLTLSGELNTSFSPRKFATGAIFPRTATPIAPTTDGQEYWAFAKLGAMPVIDEPKYQNWATATATAWATGTTNLPTQIGFFPGPSTLLGPIAAPPINGKVNTPCTISDPWTCAMVQYGLSSVYIHGDASLTNVDMKMRGVIITGKADFFAPAGNIDLNPIDTAMQSPPELWQEYPRGFGGASPYPGWVSPGSPQCPSGSSIPGNAAYPCRLLSETVPWAANTNTAYAIGAIPTSRTADIYGFVYVKGDLEVHQGTWIISGALRVDGVLTIDPGAHLYVLADDYVLNNIAVAPPLIIEPAYSWQIAPGHFHPTYP